MIPDELKRVEYRLFCSLQPCGNKATGDLEVEGEEPLPICEEHAKQLGLI